MKVLVLICLVIAPPISSAVELDFLQPLQRQMLQRMRSDGLIFKSTDTAKPVRTAQANYRIEKYDLIVARDGSTHYKVTEVCSKAATVSVYDVRTSSTPIDVKDLNMVSCKSKFRGQDINVTAGGVVIIAMRNMFGGKMTDFKAAYPLLAYEQNPLLASTPPILFGSTGTSTLDSHASMLTFLNPSQMMDCDAGGKCTEVPEAFGAAVEIFD